MIEIESKGKSRRARIEGGFFVNLCVLTLSLIFLLPLLSACSAQTPTESEPPAVESPTAEPSPSPEEQSPPPSETPDLSMDEQTNQSGDDWLFSEGNKIVDSDGNEVRLTGLNWFGYNTERLILDGSWGISIKDTVLEIADRGFNIIRVPLSLQLVNKWRNGEYPVYATVDSRVNPVFKELGTLSYLDYFIEMCAEAGVKVMLDIHSVRDKIGAHNLAVWYDPSLTTEHFYLGLEYLADRYKDDDTVIALDLKNEPHGGPWGNFYAAWNDIEDENTNWAYVAKTAALRVLDINPNILIIVEGIEVYPKDVESNSDYQSQNPDDYYYSWWGGNLRGVRDYPIDLGEHQNKLVYSPHDYGPSVGHQSWFEGEMSYERTYAEGWLDNWLFIHEENIAPILIGEWGGPMREPTLTWKTHLRQLICEEGLSHTYWCLNPNSGDTGGLLLDDWKTWDEEKYEFIKPTLWQKDGRFIGLDKTVPLGQSGYCRSEAAFAAPN
ncbi:glycoside hydrolase family 5 protein [Clostridiaceae bacterium OttesenSCG-928-D20]|nr:glycoside hydrolase family 5 protein [Clostridiaceae bacterium OttesenSCG-928-D20]